MSDKTTVSAFYDSIRSALKEAGFKPELSGDNPDGKHRVWREGYYLGTLLWPPSLQWSFTSAYLREGRDLSAEYRVNEDAMLAALQRAGFHAYRKGGLLYVCCNDAKHDEQAEPRKAANA